MVSLWYLYGMKYVRGYIKHFLKWPLAFSLALGGFAIELRYCRLELFIYFLYLFEFYNSMINIDINIDFTDIVYCYAITLNKHKKCIY